MLQTHNQVKRQITFLQKKMTPTQIAIAIGITTSALYGWLRGEYRPREHNVKNLHLLHGKYLAKDLSKLMREETLRLKRR